MQPALEFTLQDNVIRARQREDEQGHLRSSQQLYKVKSHGDAHQFPSVTILEILAKKYFGATPGNV